MNVTKNAPCTKSAVDSVELDTAGIDADSQTKAETISRRMLETDTAPHEVAMRPQTGDRRRGTGLVSVRDIAAGLAKTAENTLELTETDLGEHIDPRTK